MKVADKSQHRNLEIVFVSLTPIMTKIIIIYYVGESEVKR